MADNYSAYLDYQEIRRRVERRLSRGYFLLAHLILYLMAVLVITWNGLYWFYSYNYVDSVNYSVSQYVSPQITGGFALWSIALLMHAFLTWRKSAAGGARERAIERELRERLEHDDTTLLEDRRRAFQIHALLEGDIRRRATVIYMLLPFLLVNAAVWGSWVYERITHPGDSQYLDYPWGNTLSLAPVMVLPLLVLVMVLQRRYQRRVRQILSNWDTLPLTPKRKRSIPEYQESYLAYLADDSELVEWDDNQLTQNERKMKRTGS